jgi:hypothetical protein
MHPILCVDLVSLVGLTTPSTAFISSLYILFRAFESHLRMAERPTSRTVGIFGCANKQIGSTSSVRSASFCRTLSPPLMPLRARKTGCHLRRSQTYKAPMKAIPAEVIAVDTQGDQYHVVVRIGARYRGSFNTLVFEKNKPFIGSCHDGRLDLVYHQNPDLKMVFEKFTSVLKKR